MNNNLPVSVQVDATWQAFPLTVNLLFESVQDLAGLPGAMAALENAGATPPEVDHPAADPAALPIPSDDLLARLSQRQRRELVTLAGDSDFSLADLVRVAVIVLLRMARNGVLNLEAFRND